MQLCHIGYGKTLLALWHSLRVFLVASVAAFHSIKFSYSFFFFFNLLFYMNILSFVCYDEFKNCAQSEDSFVGKTKRFAWMLGSSIDLCVDNKNSGKLCF